MQKCVYLVGSKNRQIQERKENVRIQTEWKIIEKVGKMGEETERKKERKNGIKEIFCHTF